MIKIPHAYNCRDTYVAESEIASIVSTSSSSNYSLRAIVKLKDGTIIETSMDAAEIIKRMEEKAEK